MPGISHPLKPHHVSYVTDRIRFWERLAAAAETVVEGVPCATTKVTFTAPPKAGSAIAMVPSMMTTGTATQVPSALWYSA